MRTARVITLAVALCTAFALHTGYATAVELTPKEELGKAIFFDTRLSVPPGQSCATCHDPAAGFADPRPGSGTSQGAVHSRFGKRNSPTVAYANLSPTFFLNTTLPGPTPGGVYEGGQNWDGNAATLADQAKLPFLEPLEMNNPKISTVVKKVERAEYAGLFRQVYGAKAFRNPKDAFGRIADAIAAYESSPEVNSFSSKYDAFLAGEATMSEEESRGLELFRGKAACNRCHPSLPEGMPHMGATVMMVPRPVFTSRHHANIGLPANPANRYYGISKVFNRLGRNWIDLGTGATVGKPDHYGRFKIPTLRNVAKTAPYGHNGVIPDLATMVDFYNTRDVAGAGWASPEWGANIIKRDKLGSLGLTEQEEADIVAFLHTLSDGWIADPE